MKVGIISDIHGNTAALRTALAVLDDADRVVCLGDAINQQRFSNEVVSILRENKIPTIWGNHEAQFFGSQGQRARAAPWIDPDLLEWLRDCPTTLTLSLQSNTVLLVHSSPVTTPYGDYLLPGTHAFMQQFDHPAADLILCGHTHQPALTVVGNTLVVNPGSVGEGRPVADGFISSCAVLTLPSRQVEIRDFVPEQSR
jgi:putative phosphoesterase